MSQQHEDYQRIASAINYLENNFKEQPSLFDVANHLYLSEFHLQRLFQRWAGISPKRFVQFLTAEYAREQLSASMSTLDVAHNVGLSGTGRLHDLMVNVYAMTPGELKNGGEGLEIAYGFHTSPFGECLIATTSRGICHLSFVEGDEDHLIVLMGRFPNATYIEDTTVIAPVADKIFNLKHGDLSLHIKGTNFQIRVWEALLQIPCSDLVTYEHIADAIEQPGASRAVGNAVGQNNVAFLIPCHRVIRKTGAIGGYRWGSERKRIMIGWEAAQMQTQM